MSEKIYEFCEFSVAHEMASSAGIFNYNLLRVVKHILRSLPCDSGFCLLLEFISWTKAIHFEVVLWWIDCYSLTLNQFQKIFCNDFFAKLLINPHVPKPYILPYHFLIFCHPTILLDLNLNLLVHSHTCEVWRGYEGLRNLYF